MGIKKGFQVVFSEELPDKESIVPCEDRNKKSQVGTISYIPAVFGCVCAQAAVQHLLAADRLPVEAGNDDRACHCRPDRGSLSKNIPDKILVS